ncbi:hypothetical protein SS50377_25177 [Spironucleus salmonicida]|uniref:Uncharacterized protein n=1 Tax=Spironucleus salmonicida TaxID=348837 RepID=A0A9P8LR85_9EUKA|nr:hypothetical protein SS50377_25177 [Spironucleus salmonicida]
MQEHEYGSVNQKDPTLESPPEAAMALSDTRDVGSGSSSLTRVYRSGSTLACTCSGFYCAVGALRTPGIYSQELNGDWKMVFWRDKGAWFTVVGDSFGCFWRVLLS